MGLALPPLPEAWMDRVLAMIHLADEVKRVWTRDTWHLLSRLLCKVLSHTLALFLNQMQGNQPLHLARLLT